MRHLRLTLGLVASVGAFALAASPALASEFFASKEGKTNGSSETVQAFKFGAFKIKCAKVSTTGAVNAGSETTYATKIKYAKCLTEARIGTKPIFLASHFVTPLAIEYHANGFVETGSETTEVEGEAVVTGGSAEIKVNTGKTAEFANSECHLRWPAQTIPLKAEKHPEEPYSSATYANATRPHAVSKTFPEGLQHYIVISNEFKGIKYELEGEPCETWGKEEGPEGGGGTYTGSFPQYLSGGNLEFH